MFKKYATYIITNLSIKFGIVIYGFLVWLLLGILFERFTKSKTKQEYDPKTGKPTPSKNSLSGTGGLGAKWFTTILPTWLLGTSLGPGMFDEAYNESSPFFQFTPSARKLYHVRDAFNQVFSHFNIVFVTDAVCRVHSWMRSQLLERTESKKMQDLYLDFTLFDMNERAITGISQAFQVLEHYGYDIDEYCEFCSNLSVKVYCAENPEKRKENAIIISEFEDFYWFEHKKIKYAQWQKAMIKRHNQLYKQRRKGRHFKYYMDIMKE